MSKKKVLMIVGDYNEDLEVFFPYQVLTMLEYPVDTISPGKKKGSHIVTAIHDHEGRDLQTYTEKLGHKFPVTAHFDTVDLSTYEALIIPGGRAAEYQRMDKNILAIIQHFHKENKLIGCICHGIQILAEADILKNKKCTAAWFCEPDVRRAGGHFVAHPQEKFVIDGKLVTGTTWFDNPAWMGAFVRMLEADG